MTIQTFTQDDDDITLAASNVSTSIAGSDKVHALSALIQQEKLWGQCFVLTQPPSSQTHVLHIFLLWKVPM
jgi:hypothetical protein